MLCTRDLGLVPLDQQPQDLALHAVFENGGVVRVFEVVFDPHGSVEFHGWRSFRMDSLHSGESKPPSLANYVREERQRHDHSVKQCQPD